MLIYNAHLHTMDGRVIENGWLQTDGPVIRALGEAPSRPALSSGDIDANGRILTPGLIDAHCHVGIFGDSLGEIGEDGNEAADPITPHLRALDAINPNDRCFSDALRAGVTSLLTGPGSANPIGGQIVAMKTHGRRVDDMLLASPSAMKFAMGENPKRVYGEKKESPITRMGVAALIREALYKTLFYRDKLAAASQRKEERPDYNIKWESLLPVLDGTLPAHFHAHSANDIFTALRIAKEFSLNCVIIHGTGSAPVADLLANEGTRVVVGPLLTERVKPEMKDLSLSLPYALHRAGVVTAICTDAPVIPPEYLPMCAGLAAKAGLPPEEALLSITRRAAVISRLDGRVGALRPGLDADIVLWNEHPLSLNASPDIVLLSGKKIISTLPR